MKEHAQPVNSIDPDSTDYADFEAFGRARWSNIYNGVFYIREMRPCLAILEPKVGRLSGEFPGFCNFGLPL